MEKIISARDLLEPTYILEEKPTLDHVSILMKEFAKMHVERALKHASEKTNMILTADGGDYDAVCETLILNSYPLDNIK